jgi:hypothetical protein
VSYETRIVEVPLTTLASARARVEWPKNTSDVICSATPSCKAS